MKISPIELQWLLDPDSDTRVAHRLRDLISNSGLSLPEFAKRVQISRNTLIRYRDNKTSMPLDFLVRVCRQFKVSLIWLTLGIENDGRIDWEWKIDLDKVDPLPILVYQAQKKTGIILSAEILKKFTNLIKDHFWNEFERNIADLLRTVVKLNPTWEFKAKPESGLDDKIVNSITPEQKNCNKT